MGVNGAWSSQVIIASQVIIQGNPDGMFIYNGTPATGSLALSAAAQAGTDPYGNAYVQGIGLYSGGVLVDRIDPVNGFTAYTASQYVQMAAAGLTFGAFDPNTGTLHPTGAAITDFSLGNPFNQDVLQLISGLGNGNDQTTVQIQSGYTGVGTGQQTTPQIILKDSAGSSAVDVLLPGTHISTTTAGVPFTWQTPTFATGYTNQNCKFRQMPLNAVFWRGEFSQNTGVAGAGSAIVFTLPAGYRPLQEQIVPVSWRTTAGVSKGTNAYLAFETNGQVILGWSSATANGDRFSCSTLIDLGNIT